MLQEISNEVLGDQNHEQFGWRVGRFQKTDSAAIEFIATKDQNRA